MQQQIGKYIGNDETLKTLTKYNSIHFLSTFCDFVSANAQ